MRRNGRKSFRRSDVEKIIFSSFKMTKKEWIANRGKKQSRKSKKKELNKTLEKNSKTKDPFEMTAAELSNSPEYQELKRKYGKKKKEETVEEQLDYIWRNFFFLRELRVSLQTKEEFEKWWEENKDPDFHVDPQRDGWRLCGSPPEEEDDEKIIQKFANLLPYNTRRELADRKNRDSFYRESSAAFDQIKWVFFPHHSIDYATWMRGIMNLPSRKCSCGC